MVTYLIIYQLYTFFLIHPVLLVINIYYWRLGTSESMDCISFAPLSGPPEYFESLQRSQVSRKRVDARDSFKKLRSSFFAQHAVRLFNVTLVTLRPQWEIFLRACFWIMNLYWTSSLQFKNWTLCRKLDICITLSGDLSRTGTRVTGQTE